MKPTVLVANGPNLNLLGSRESTIYGDATLADVEARLRSSVPGALCELEFLQTNHEGVLLDRLHRADFAGVVINAGAWTHTSIALRDALVGIDRPYVEIHISNVHRREDFRRHSHISAAAAGIVVGFGVAGYELALAGLLEILDPAAGGEKAPR